MARRFDLPRTLALFPLPGVVLMPRARLPFQIFEPRYLQMVEDALRTNHRLIGLIQPQDSDAGDLATIGSAGRIVAFSETDDGRYMITLRTISRFRLDDCHEGFTPYLQGDADWTGYLRDTINDPEKDPGFNRPALLAQLRRYVDLYELSTDWDAAEAVDDEMLINSLATLLPFEPEEKQALLEAPTLTDRRKLLEGLIEYALRSGNNEEIIQ